MPVNILKVQLRRLTLLVLYSKRVRVFEMKTATKGQTRISLVPISDEDLLQGSVADAEGKRLRSRFLCIGRTLHNSCVALSATVTTHKRLIESIEVKMPGFRYLIGCETQSTDRIRTRELKIKCSILLRCLHELSIHHWAHILTN